MPDHDVKKLVVRVPNWIGDAVMSEPVLATLHGAFPRAELTLLAKPAVAELFHGHPGVDRVLRYEAPGRHAGLLGKYRLAAGLRQERFDVAVLLQNAFEAALLAWLARIPRRYGYATDGRTWLLTDAVPVPRDASQLHQAEYFQRMLGSLAPGASQRPPRLYLTPEDEQVLAARLTSLSVGEGDLLIGLNPGSTYGSAKRWLPERFAETADALVDQLSRQHDASVRVIIVGASGEEDLGDLIGRRMRHRPIQLAGRTTVRELMAFVKRCHLFVTNDTGPMHIAAAFDVPVLAIFGPTNAVATSPAGGPCAVVRHHVDCAPCLLRECPIDHRCMTRLTVEQVLETGRTQLDVLHQGKEGKSDAPRRTRSSSGATPAPLEGVPVFLDRDGTLNRDTGYVKTPDELEVLPGVVDAVARLNEAGAIVVLVTNQSGIGRGLFSSDDLERIHERLRAVLARGGARLDGIYHCPHLPEQGCGCRKPRAGMVERAAAQLGLDPARGYLVGDQQRDIELARTIGAKSVLVLTGPPSAQAEQALRRASVAPDHLTSGFGDAIEWIIQDARMRRSQVTREALGESYDCSRGH